VPALRTRQSSLPYVSSTTDNRVLTSDSKVKSQGTVVTEASGLLATTLVLADSSLEEDRAEMTMCDTPALANAVAQPRLVPLSFWNVM
jgi:hypothetical protein